MKTRSKIWIDRTLGLPLALAMNGAARLLAVLVRRDHSARPNEVRRIVVAKFLGMGSILHATPMIAALRAKFPQAEILFLTSRRNRALVERLEGVNGILTADDESLPRLLLSTARALVELTRRRVDLYFDLEVYSTYSCLMSLCSLARNRYGFYRYFARFKKGIYTHLMYFNVRRPIRTIYLQLARMSGVTEAVTERLGPVRVTEEDRRGLRAKWPALTPGRYVALNPNASDLLVERRWPLPNFAAVARHAASGGWTVCLIGSADEKGNTAQLEGLLDEETRGRTVNTAGTLELGELLALLQGARAVVTNDSGPMHMAVALEAPTLCLFGPVEPAHYGFARADVAVLHHPVFCCPCAHEVDRPPCAGMNECMQRISPEEVICRLDGFLDGQREAVSPETPAGTADALGRPLGMVLPDSVPWSGRPCPICGERLFRTCFARDGFLFERCSGCALERVSPQPSEALLNSIYRDSYYDSWGLREDAESVARLKKANAAAQLKSVLPRWEGLRVLDCGAATGFLMEVVAAQGGEPYGLERSAFGVEEIRRKFGADRALAGAMEGMALAEKREFFDAVSMFDFLEHVRDPRAVLRAARESLKPGGVLILCTPNAAGLSRRLLGPTWPHYKIEHLHYFDAANLKRLLMEEGFEDVRKRGAWKVMSLGYAGRQLAAYPPPGALGRVMQSFGRAVSRSRSGHFRILFGEMIVRARKGGAVQRGTEAERAKPPDCGRPLGMGQ